MAHGFEGPAATQPAASEKHAAGPLWLAIACLNRLVEIASSIALVVASFVLTYAVITRYFLHFSTDWQDEVSVFLIVGSVFMSAAAVQARRGHVGIEAIVGLLSARANKVRMILVDVFTFLFCAYFSWKSLLLLHEAITEGYRTASTWQPPLWIPYSLMTAGMTLLSVQVLLQVISAFWPQASDL